MKLKLRTDVKNNKAFYNLEVCKGVSYSVVNFGEVMRTAPKELRGVTFEGWEAMRLKSNGGLDTSQQIRASNRADLLAAVEKKHQGDLNVEEAVKSGSSVSKEVNITEEGTYYKIKPVAVGSIEHYFMVKEGRATRYRNNYSKEHEAIPLTSAATIDEVENLLSVLVELRRIMKESLTA